MSIKLSWLDDQQAALLYVFPEQWSWEDFYNVKVEADKWLDQCSHDVVLLFDMSKSRSIPPGALARSRYLVSKAHPRGKPIVLIGENHLIASLLNMAARFHPNIRRLICTAPTLEEAQKVIAQQPG
jgi:hypothetical protein